jgi:hypothetical protein
VTTALFFLFVYFFGIALVATVSIDNDVFTPLGTVLFALTWPFWLVVGIVYFVFEI